MDSPVQKIKERLGIEEVVSSYVKLERAGANLKARCPFHNEKTPSFFISPERGTYYCFGCSASGDIFSFVEEFEGLDFRGALKLLADRAGVELTPYTKEMKEAESEKEKLYRIMEEAALYYQKNLKDNTEAREYLLSRGLAEKTIEEFEIGFAKPDWRELYTHLTNKGSNDEMMEKAGLVKKTEKGYYDRFRGRIMFPIRDSGKRLVAFSGRIFVDDGKSAKYLNSPETPIFRKSSILYGIDRAKDSIRKNNFSILVEGQMDLIMSHQAGFRNTVASSGTALSEPDLSPEGAVTNMGLIRRLSPNLVVGFDGDAAGIAATLRAGKIALGLGMDVKVAAVPADSDPAELIKNGGPDAWRMAVRNSAHIVEFLLRKIMERHDDPRKVGREVREQILPLVGVLQSSIEQAHFLKKISTIAGIDELALRNDFEKMSDARRGEPAEQRETETAAVTLFRKDYITRRLLGIILWQRTQPKKVFDTAPLVREIESLYKASLDSLLLKEKDNAEDLIYEAEVFYEGGADIAQDVDEMLRNLAEEILKEELAAKMKELYRAEEKKDKEASARILEECQALNEKLQDIKNGRVKVHT